ncbi:MAG: SEC-C metal-binding domain-containing protein [Thermodesulfovibrionales bacterium]
MWICIAVLWERWFPESPSLEMLDDMMQGGYERLESGDSVGTCDIWLKVWRSLVDIADQTQSKTISNLDRIFRGTQSIFNWVQDFETELSNASRKRKALIGERISFCERLLPMCLYEDNLLLENMRRALADSYFDAGDQEKTDSLYREWLAADPRWGWGWIGWADCYWLMLWRERNFEKGERILKEGLAVPDVRDKKFITERLKELYSDAGRAEDLPNLRDIAKSRAAEYTGGDKKAAQAGQVKIGWNAPCPCGSGKKYKKCCGMQ